MVNEPNQCSENRGGLCRPCFFLLDWCRESEELKNARLEIQVLKSTIQGFRLKQTNDAVALSELRIAESAHRNELSRMRDQLSELERRAAKNPSVGKCLEFQRLAVEKEELLREAEVGLEFCYKHHR